MVVLSGMLGWLETEQGIVPQVGRGHRPALRGGRPPQQGTPDHLHPGTVPVDLPPEGRGPRQPISMGVQDTRVDRYRAHRGRGRRGEVRDGPRGQTHHIGDLGVPHATGEDAVRTGRHRVRPVPDRLQVSGPTKQLAQFRTQREWFGQDIGRGTQEFIGRLYYRAMFLFKT